MCGIEAGGLRKQAQRLRHQQQRDTGAGQAKRA
jgi:hypothetical protein